MQTRLATFAGRVLESSWLAALIIVPLLFNVYTERVFEEDKIPLLRSISLMVVAWGIIFIIEKGRAALTHDDRPWYRWPLVIPALILSGAYIIATIFSVNPSISWWGAYIRRQGTYTWLSYVAIFLAILLVVRDKRQVNRIVNVMLLASVPAALYAFMQNQGLDPLPWGGDVQRRVSSVAGNPIFISAYLIMVMPLTVMRVIEHFRTLWGEDQKGKDDREDGKEKKSSGGAEPNYLASALLAGAYLFLLFLQVITIIFSQSRGPLLGILIGLTFFAILGSLPVSRWLTLAFAGIAVAGAAFLIVFNLPNSPLESLKELPYIGRMGRVFEVNEGNGLVRALIWQGAENMIQDNPAQSIVGFGPETMYMAYTPYYPPELAQVEKRNASPDRAHNETFDSIVMTGWIGMVAQFSVFIAIFYYALKWLGLVVSQRQRLLFFGLLAAGGIIGTIVPPFLDNGSWRFSGVTLPFGLMAGLVLYLLLYAFAARGNFNANRHPQYLLLVALLSAIIAHFIEIHFGIAIGVTRLYFWVMAALVVVVGWQMTGVERSESVAVEAAGETRKRRSTTNSSGGGRRDARAEIANMIVYSLMMGIVLMVMSFDYITPSVEISARGYVMVWLFAATYTFGALLVSAEVAQESAGRLGWITRLVSYVAITLGAWFVFMMIFLPAQTPSSLSGNVTPEQLVGAGMRLANIMSVVYIFTFIYIFASAWFLQGEEPQPKTLSRAPWIPITAGVLTVLVIPMIVATNLNVTRADVLAKQGAAYERQQQWDVAEVFYEAALNMQPAEDRYFLNMGRVYLEKARRAPDVASRDAAFRQGEAVLVQAQNTNPLNMDHARNLASLHRVWASVLRDSDPVASQMHYDQAEAYYQEATALSPNNAALWNDYALLRVERDNGAGAEELFAKSLSIDSQYINTYILRGNFYLQEERWEEALSDYENATALDGASIPALSGEAFALAKLERLPEAIDKNLQILAVDPMDFTAQKNLALLYRDSGQLDEALRYANSALTVAPENERAGIETLIQELTTASSG